MQIDKVNRNTYWSDTADFIESNYPNTTIIINQHDYWFLAEINDNPAITPHFLDEKYIIPDIDQLVITTFTQDAHATQDHAPLDNDLTFFNRKKNTTSEEFITYLEKNGERVFTGYFGRQPAVTMYKIHTAPEKEPGIKISAPPPESKSFVLKAMWSLLCTAHRSNPLVVESLFTQTLAEPLRQKCG
jgi:hypothetical protein